MISCPNCKNEALDGAVFCLECGARLFGPDPRSTQSISTRDMAAVASDRVFAEQPPASAKSWGTLHLIESGHLLPLIERKEYSLGRVSDGQSTLPDIDLSPHRAFECGVSRVHAIIKIVDNRMYIVDLGSSNGTFVNGVRLEPQIETSIKNGDMISLGKLRMQVLFSYVN